VRFGLGALLYRSITPHSITPRGRFEDENENEDENEALVRAGHVFDKYPGLTPGPPDIKLPGYDHPVPPGQIRLLSYDPCGTAFFGVRL
jgi:hypothetical protein